jgi:hypothetical protein
MDDNLPEDEDVEIEIIETGSVFPPSSLRRVRSVPGSTKLMRTQSNNNIADLEEEPPWKKRKLSKATSPEEYDAPSINNPLCSPPSPSPSFFPHWFF